VSRTRPSVKVMRMLIALALTMLGGAAAIARAATVTTDSFPRTWNRSWANVWFNGVAIGSGHIGVDIGMWHPGVPGHSNSGSVYSPCLNPGDPYFAGCAVRPGYYRVQHYAPGWSDFPYGIFIENTNNGVNHDWAKRVNYAALEVYPYDNIPGTVDPPGEGPYWTETNRYGGVRMGIGSVGFVDVFPTHANGGYYSGPLGTVTQLPSVDGYGSGGAARLNGFIYAGWPAPAPHENASIHLFQQSCNHTTSTGHPICSFASTHNKADGYYTSGPLFPGTYRIYIEVYQLENGVRVALLRTVSFGASVFRSYERLDFDVNNAAKCFGYTADPNCIDTNYP
jgi:hypothetical protein